MADLDLDDLTVRELVEIEKCAGVPFTKLFPDGEVTALGLAAFSYAAKRREDPSVTWEQVLDSPLTDVTPQEASEGPTDAATSS